ncbi:MAG TPA: decaprenyl-phosphate phosphoribosyltransferase [Candidatus Hydrogenedentes bacterium]|nr:decaprenyl-phosphate phosphoribosyltransferase [Candidatus Hydrogenedentota bacterium]
MSGTVSDTHRPPATAGAVLRLLRPYQWIKNGVVLLPLVFAQELNNPTAVTRALAATGIFCLISCAVYIFNDLLDRDQDRLHPDKRNRPLASGAVSVRTAALLCVVLVTAGLTGAAALSPRFSLAAFGYLALMAAYSLGLKHLLLIDVICVALGFVLRATGGAVAIDVRFSNWLVVCTLFLALFLALGKRRHELAVLNADAPAHRAVHDAYSVDFLDAMILLVAGAAMVSYTIYTCSQEVVTRIGTDKMYLTLPFVVYGLGRYLWLIRQGRDGGDPSMTLLRDYPLTVTVFCWLASCALVMHGAFS